MISAALAILETDEQRNELAEFYKENFGKLYSIAISRLHNQQSAEDAVQDTFMRICKYPQKFFKIEAQQRLPYAVIVIKNVVRNIAKDKSKHEYDELCEDIPWDARSIEDVAIGKIFSKELEKFINSMPETLRHAITLKIVYDLTTRQIADMLGISEDTVRKRISNSYKQIRDFLNEGSDNG